jgi:CHAT domain-containing protein
MIAATGSGSPAPARIVGRDVSFVWAVPKAGKASFAVVPLSADDIEDQVTALRRAVTTQITYVHDIPPFDIVSAHDLYKALLQPVEEGWRSAKTVFVVTNGALGMLPFGMLPTAPASVDLKTEVAFSDYRNVPWLARSHALVSLPSTGALTTLRSLPPGAASRSPMIGFGDPYFSSEQAAAATGTTEVAALSVPETSIVRGVPVKRRAMPEIEGVDSADLALLPRLPDTADELQAVAKALGLDPATALKLGRAANEQVVKTSDLSRYRIVAFATHGLVAGELNGLTQPALALSAPDVAGVDGDGLLTMEEILALRLNADWVILSACNTGPESARVRKRRPALVGPSSMPAAGRCWSPTGRCIRNRRANSSPTPSAGKPLIPSSIVARRCGRP